MPKTIIVVNYTKCSYTSIMQLVSKYLSWFKKGEELKSLYFQIYYSAFWIKVTYNKCSVRLDVFDWSNRTLYLAKQLGKKYNTGELNETNN